MSTAVQATPTFRKYLTSDAAGLQSVVVETSQHVVLTQSLSYAQDGAVTIPIPTGADVDYTVYADEVTVFGDLVLPGRSLTIVARTLTAKGAQANASGVRIDVSGSRGAAPPPKVDAGSQLVDGKALGTVGKPGAGGHGTLIERVEGDDFVLNPSATSDGAPGWSATDHPVMHGLLGSQGAAGEAGGTITIVTDLLQGLQMYLHADGGDGGDGQDGQDGVKGGTGGSGANAQWPAAGDTYAASNGGAAGHGGDAGLGGTRGAAGKSGTITVVAAATWPMGVNSHGGLPGQDGESGNPGDAGEPGAGGLGYKGTYTASFWSSSFLKLILADGNAGDKGSPGAAIEPRSIFTVPVQGGTRKWLGRTAPVRLPSNLPDIRFGADAALAAVVAAASTGWLQLMVEKARTAYLTTDPADQVSFTALGEEIDWLVTVLSAKDRALAEGADGKQAIQSALHNAWAMSQTHLLGQDAFGMAPRWVPTMSVSTYLAQGQDAVSTLKGLEQATRAFWSAAAQASQDQSGLALDSAETTAAHKQLDGATTQAKADIKAARDAGESRDRPDGDQEDAGHRPRRVRGRGVQRRSTWTRRPCSTA